MKTVRVMISNEVPNNIVSFIHCKLCLEEFYAQPSDLSPREYAQVEIGFTKPGIQVWCKRHEVNIMHIDFEGAGPFPTEIGR